MSPGDVRTLGFTVFAVAVILRLLCGRFVKRGSKSADDARFDTSLAARWLGSRVANIGAAMSALLTLLSGALLLYSFSASS